MIDALSVLGVGSAGSLADAPSDPPKLDLSLLERTLRRGLSDTTRLFMHAAQQALHAAGVNAREPHVIFASAFGEIATAEALFKEAFESDGSSPARFRNSVHNTAAGLLSISAQNRRAATAIAAGWDTVAMGLCEASGQLASEDGCVLLVFAEERVPSALSVEHPHGPLGVAFVLGRAEHSPRAARLENLRRTQPPAEASAFSLASSPIEPALALARSVLQRDRRTVVVGLGEPPLCVDVRGYEP